MALATMYRFPPPPEMSQSKMQTLPSELNKARAQSTSSTASSMSESTTFDPKISQSWSNYELIRRGTYEQAGLNYPKSFITSTTTTGGRARHSRGERQRRVRMNAALQRLAEVLLENQQDAAKEISSAGEITASKAALVEKATLFIQQLQEEIDKLKKAMPKSSSPDDADELLEPMQG